MGPFFSPAPKKKRSKGVEIPEIRGPDHLFWARFWGFVYAWAWGRLVSGVSKRGSPFAWVFFPLSPGDSITPKKPLGPGGWTPKKKSGGMGAQKNSKIPPLSSGEVLKPPGKKFFPWAAGPQNPLHPLFFCLPKDLVNMAPPGWLGFKADPRGFPLFFPPKMAFFCVVGFLAVFGLGKGAPFKEGPNSPLFRPPGGTPQNVLPPGGGESGVFHLSPRDLMRAVQPKPRAGGFFPPHFGPGDFLPRFAGGL